MWNRIGNGSYACIRPANVLVMTSFFPDSPLATKVASSPNHPERKGVPPPHIILLHYTRIRDGRDGLVRLREPSSKVSCHYLIFEDGTVVQLVPEARRAWHAGVSAWKGETDINAHSIGIEIVNPGHGLGYPDFTEPQIRSVI